MKKEEILIQSADLGFQLKEISRIFQNLIESVSEDHEKRIFGEMKAWADASILLTQEIYQTVNGYLSNSDHDEYTETLSVLSAQIHKVKNTLKKQAQSIQEGYDYE